MQFISLGSGSRGNATLVKSNKATLMVDCGLSVKETIKRMELANADPDSLDGILVTHEHGDHVRGVASFSRRYGLPVYASTGTAKYFQDENLDIRQVNVHKPFRVKDLQVEPVPVPHDAREPCQYIFNDSRKCFGMLTDVGSITPHIVQSYAACDAMLLEFNHDSAMLDNCRYPVSVKRRIAGDLGHLSNHQSSGLLEQLVNGALRFVVAGHLSESNNSHDEVNSVIGQTVNGHSCRYEVAFQDKATDWYSLDELC